MSCHVFLNGNISAIGSQPREFFFFFSDYFVTLKTVDLQVFQVSHRIITRLSPAHFFTLCNEQRSDSCRALIVSCQQVQQAEQLHIKHQESPTLQSLLLEHTLWKASSFCQYESDKWAHRRCINKQMHAQIMCRDVGHGVEPLLFPSFISLLFCRIPNSESSQLARHSLCVFWAAGHIKYLWRLILFGIQIWTLIKGRFQKLTGKETQQHFILQSPPHLAPFLPAYHYNVKGVFLHVAWHVPCNNEPTRLLETCSLAAFYNEQVFSLWWDGFSSFKLKY